MIKQCIETHRQLHLNKKSSSSLSSSRDSGTILQTKMDHKSGMRDGGIEKKEDGIIITSTNDKDKDNNNDEHGLNSDDNSEERENNMHSSSSDADDYLSKLASFEILVTEQGTLYKDQIIALATKSRRTPQSEGNSRSKSKSNNIDCDDVFNCTGVDNNNNDNNRNHNLNHNHHNNSKGKDGKGNINNHRSVIGAVGEGEGKSKVRGTTTTGTSGIGGEEDWNSVMILIPVRFGIDQFNMKYADSVSKVSMLTCKCVCLYPYAFLAASSCAWTH